MLHSWEDLARGFTDTYMSELLVEGAELRIMAGSEEPRSMVDEPVVFAELAVLAVEGAEAPVQVGPEEPITPFSTRSRSRPWSSFWCPRASATARSRTCPRAPATAPVAVATFLTRSRSRPWSS